MRQKNPKVFISYCQENVGFSDKVLEFSNRLRREGIDTILDQYEESPPEGWPRWMENSISLSDYVVIVCTEEYLNRLMTRASGVGKGVKWESNIIYQHLYNEETINERYIPIVFNHIDSKFIPIPLQGVTYYDISEKKWYDALYWRLRGIKKTVKPELGELRPLPEKERKSLFISSPIDLESWDKATWRGAAFLMDPTGENFPCFLLPFTNEKPARKIFSDWRAIYGEEDIDDEIRIALIEGDIPGQESGYSIHITPNIDNVFKRMDSNGFVVDKSILMSISRIQRANPTDNFAMLNMFKKQYHSHCKYLLAPAVLDEVNGRIKPMTDLGIIKNNIVFRHVDDINDNDIDSAIFGPRGKR